MNKDAFSFCDSIHIHSLTILIPFKDKFLSSSVIKAGSFVFVPFLFISSLLGFGFTPFGEETHLKKLRTSLVKTMKVHPLPKKRNNITIRYYNNGSTSSNLRNPASGGSHNKKLRRLPHIFNRVLELPFRSDADVSVEEGPDFFRFVAETDAIAEGVRAHMVEIYPGVTKIVVRPNAYLGIASLDDLELDMWRFRLPESTRPELASAIFEDGELVVTIPKGDGLDQGNENDGGDLVGGMGNNNNNRARLVLVQ